MVIQILIIIIISFHENFNSHIYLIKVEEIMIMYFLQLFLNLLLINHKIFQYH